MSYAALSDIQMVFGSTNVDKWADLNNDGNTAARIAWALDLATREIDERLRRGPYEVPFPTVPDTIRDMAAQLAGVYLYNSRGITDTEDAPNPVRWHEKDVKNKLREIQTGLRKLDLEELVVRYPRAIT